MTRRQKISLGMWLLILIVILLSKMASAQFQLESVSGYGYKKTVRTSGFIVILDSSITIRTNYDYLTFNIKKHFKLGRVEYFEMDTMGCRTFIWIESWSDYGEITLSRRFQKKPEQIIRYRFKKRL